VTAEQDEDSHGRRWPLVPTEGNPVSAIRRFFSSALSAGPSVGEALRRATPHLHAVSATPRLDAELLLSHVTSLSRTSLVAHPEQTLSLPQESAYAELVAQRALHVPLPYLTGFAEFYGLEFEVTPEVLIPRPETELLVDLALARQPATVVDVCTGSGCVAIALASRLSQALIYASDISQAALAVARRNAERHGVAERVHLILGDILTPRPPLVEVIVANPPYVADDEWASLPVSVRDYEPRIALDGGPDGLTIIQRLLNEAPAVLRPGGHLLVEIGARQGEAAAHLARTAFPNAAVSIHPDLAGLDRVLEVAT
jgi:release factor glutamine methyltransferase